ncbi:MAG: glycosyltransferase [Chloroflexi bacterium]|nr:glycosyltransferase [Chloroflexota bacterium]
MNFRFQKFTTTYQDFAHQFLAANPGCWELSYQELYDRFINTRYGLSDYYARHLQSLGHEAQDLFASFEPLQKAWAREHGVKYGERNWLRDIVLAQVKSFQPDVLYLQDLYLFDAPFRRQLRDACDKPVLVVGWRSAPTRSFAELQDLDLVLTSVPNLLRAFRQAGVRTECIPFAFEHTLLDVLPPVVEADLDFTFVGSLQRKGGHYSRRYALVEQLMAATPLQVWGEEVEHLSAARRLLYKTIYQANVALSTIGLAREQRQKWPLVHRGASWTSDPTRAFLRERFPHRCHAPVFGLHNYEVLRRSRITLNSHIDVAENYAGNIRLFEATGVGTCLLTDWKDNLPELFEPDVEVATYRSAEECVEKARYLLDHPAESKAIAAAGQRRTLRDHTYYQRVQRLGDILSSHMAKVRRPLAATSVGP